jgi:SAM-dependent methyltransferase
VIKLDIGCGRSCRKGYVGVDRFNEKADIMAPAHELPYGGGEVDEIYTSHMVEHLTPQEFEAALREWRRALKPGGKLTVRCPNFELYVREWLEGDYGHRWGWGIVNIFGWQDRGPGMWHHTGFTVRRLEKVLPEFGFEVVACKVTETRPFTRGTEEYRPDGDLYCECVRA